MILVMADGGFLKPPAEGEKPSLIWEMTWKRVDRILPNLYMDIFPETKATEAKPSEFAAVPHKAEGEAEVPDAKRDRPRETEPGSGGREES